jgi:hypothetical protein
MYFTFFFLPFFGGTEVWTQGFSTCKANALPLEPYFQTIFVPVIWQCVSHKLFAKGGLELQSS